MANQNEQSNRWTMAARRISEEEFIQLMGQLEVNSLSRKVMTIQDGQHGGERIHGYVIVSGKVSTLWINHLMFYWLETNHLDDEGILIPHDGNDQTIRTQELVIYDGKGRDIGREAVEKHIRDVTIPHAVKRIMEPLTVEDRDEAVWSKEVASAFYGR